MTARTKFMIYYSLGVVPFVTLLAVFGLMQYQFVRIVFPAIYSGIGITLFKRYS